MADVLQAIVACARTSALARERSGRVAVERAAAKRTPQAGRFSAAVAAAGVRVIAECKRRSPSRGVLRRDYDPGAIARGYEQAGAAAISVLTEPAFFDGALADLEAVRAAVHLPVLRKDFIVTDFQMIEARAAGADAALLIVAALNDYELRDLIDAARSLQIDALVEVHDEGELDRALAAGASLIGVNSRNLKTLDVALETFDAVAQQLPPRIVAIAESGIRSGTDIVRLRALGYRAFLVGERFMTTDDPGAALATLIAEASEVRV